jgi:peptidoglycan/LPS O-acetylase OafA/YrhL
MSSHDRPVPDLSQVLSGRHLPALDGMRAVAVFIVIAYHGGLGAVPGDLGVSAFFVLSGFLITWLLLREWRADGSVSLRRFYVRRTLRIFPAYYVFLAVSFVLDRIRNDPWPDGLTAAAAGYAVNYYNALHGHPPTAIAHAWSLGVEEQFYLLWPAVFLLLARRGVRVLLPAVAGLVVAVLVWRSFLFLVGGVGTAYVYNAFDTRFDNLGVGCLLAICVERPWFDAVARTVARRVWLPLVTIVLLVWSRVGIGSAYHYSLGFTVNALLIAVLIVQLLQLSRRALWSWLEHPVTRFLGVLSYSLYLYHIWGIGAGHQLRFLPPGLQFLAGVLASIALASGSYFVIERPFLALKRRFEVGVAPARAPVMTTGVAQVATGPRVVAGRP